MLRDRFINTTAMFMAPPDGSGAAPTPASSGSSPVSSGSTPAGSSVAPGVEPPPGAPGSTVSEPASPSTDTTSDFMSIFDGPQDPAPVFPGTEVPSTAPAVTPPVPVVPAAAPAPSATPAAVVPPVAGGVAVPGEGGQPPAGTPPASGQSPALDPYDPSGLARAIQANEQATVEHVAQTLFALSQEDAQALETDVLGTVPKLFAKAFVKSQVNQLMQLAQIVPEMVRRASADLRNHTQNEDTFYSTWPQIDRQKHGDLVKRYGITYRAMNPQATRAQMIADLGPLIMMAARIPLAAAPGTAPALAQQNGGRPAAAHQPSPFTPAVSGPAATVQAPELSPVEAMFAPRD